VIANRSSGETGGSLSASRPLAAVAPSGWWWPSALSANTAIPTPRTCQGATR